MSRLFYVLAVVVLIAAFSDSISAQCYSDGPRSNYGNSYGQVPAQMIRGHRAVPQTYDQPISYNTATGRVHSNPPYGRSGRRPLLFPRLRRLIRTLLPPYGPGLGFVSNFNWSLSNPFAMTERGDVASLLVFCSARFT